MSDFLRFIGDIMSDESGVIELNSSLNSTNDSIQSYRAAVAGEEISDSQLLTCEEFLTKSTTVIKHLRSQQKVSLKTIEEMYATQIRRNKTSDRLLSGIEK